MTETLDDVGTPRNDQVGDQFGALLAPHMSNEHCWRNVKVLSHAAPPTGFDSV
ncbi:MAG TPA: hypothetical protein VGP05_02915 [Pseudonocardia sp.]|nr:hypothetical protein [Pseudonocardia sp.]